MEEGKLSHIDPLLLEKMVLKKEDAPKLTSGKKVFGELEDLMNKGNPIDGILSAPNEILEHFNNIFPEIVESNEVGTYKDGLTCKIWNGNKKDITIELDPSPETNEEGGKDVYIGGPAALYAAAIQSQSAKDSCNVLYGHEGLVGLSNWKGSASYFHIRDAIPVYYWPDNHGAYPLYATFKHALQKKFIPQMYKKQVETCLLYTSPSPRD